MTSRSDVMKPRPAGWYWVKVDGEDSPWKPRYHDGKPPGFGVWEYHPFTREPDIIGGDNTLGVDPSVPVFKIGPRIPSPDEPAPRRPHWILDGEPPLPPAEDT